jgi:ABC-2 type transport system ATP-binding protein
MRTYLEDYQRASGCTMLLASHNMGEVERMCGDVIMMRAGRIVDQGSPGDLLARYARADMEQVFLDIARGSHDMPPAPMAS